VALLNEVADDNGLGGPVAVVDAACGFAAWQLYRQGVGENEPLLPLGYFDALVKQGLCFGRAVFDAASRARRQPVAREMFAAVPLDRRPLAPLVPLPADTIAGRRASRPPGRWISCADRKRCKMSTAMAVFARRILEERFSSAAAAHPVRE
jgi:hypothetical protein